MRIIKKIPFLFILALVVAGCSIASVINKYHGYTPSEAELKQINVGVDTRDTVIEVLGTPTADGVSNNRGFYYVSSKWEHYGLAAPKVVSRDIVAISFNSNDVVSNVGHYRLQDGQLVTLVSRISEGGSEEITFVQQIFSNLRNIDASQVLQPPGQ